MKIVSALVISVILFSVLFLLGCASQGGGGETTPTLILGGTGVGPMGIIGHNAVNFTATVKTGDIPLPNVQVRFEITAGPHYPPNLAGNESYDREVWVWADAASLSCEGEYLRPLISDHYKREKIYSWDEPYVLCSTGPNGEPAQVAYYGIKPGTDTIVVSATVDGDELQETATATWQYPENTCVLDLTSNTLSPTNSVVTPVEPLGDGEAAVEIDMGAGNYSVLEMKIEIEDPQGPWLLNIGNSPTNDGAGGDGGQFANDSELDVYGDATYPNFILQLYANQYFSTPGAVVANLVNLFPPSGNVTTWVLRVKIADQLMCALVENTGALRGDPDNPDPKSPYVFRLGGADTEAGQNDFMYYAAFNRVISGRPDRTGSGVTKVTFMWRTTWPGWQI